MRNFVMKIWADVVLGVVFVVSGFVKAVDPIGLSYKIEEYLKMFQLSGWSVFSIPFSILLCTAEMTLGLLLLLRLWRRVTAVIATLFILGFTILTYLIYTDPYGGIHECGCFGEAWHLSNGATFTKNIFLLAVAGLHLWRVFKQSKNEFDYRQIALAIGVFVVSSFVPCYSYFYLPPFDFLPYNVGTIIQNQDALLLYDSDFNDITEKAFGNEKPTYLIGMQETVTQETSHKIATLYDAYKNGAINLFIASSQSEITIPEYHDIPVYFMDDMVLKSILRSAVGVVTFTADRRIAGKWNLLYTPYCFDGKYGDELTLEQIKRGMFLGAILILIMLLFYSRKKIKA